MLSKEWLRPLVISIGVHGLILFTLWQYYPQAVNSEPVEMEVSLEELFSQPDDLARTAARPLLENKQLVTATGRGMTAAIPSGPYQQNSGGASTQAAATTGGGEPGGVIGGGGSTNSGGSGEGIGVGSEAGGTDSGGPGGRNRTTRGPRVVSDYEPVYPDEARTNGWGGTVRVRVLIMEDGTLADVRLAGSSGYGVLDRAALETVRGWSFSPALRDGEPVRAWITVPIRFRLQ